MYGSNSGACADMLYWNAWVISLYSLNWSE